MAPRSKTIELDDELHLSFVEQGAPSRPPVLLLHGLGDSWRSFGPVLEHLPGSVHAFALSQRGHGDSSKTEEGFNIERSAEDIGRFLDLVRVNEAVLVGHSSSGLVSERFAIDHPDRTAGLVLIGTPTTLHEHPAAQELFDSRISKLTDPLNSQFIREFAESTIAQPVPPSFLEMTFEETSKVPARVFKEMFADLLSTDLSSQLDTIGAPVLLVWGDHDAIQFARRC